MKWALSGHQPQSDPQARLNEEMQVPYLAKQEERRVIVDKPSPS